MTNEILSYTTDIDLEIQFFIMYLDNRYGNLKSPDSSNGPKPRRHNLDLI